MNARQPLRPGIKGAQYTDLVGNIGTTAGQLLAGYMVDEDGKILLTHLEANGLDIYPLVEQAPHVMVQIEARLAEQFWPHQISLDAERRAEAHHEARRA